MDGQAVQQVAELERRTTKMEVAGRTYSPLSMKPVFYDPRPSPVFLRTLTSLVDYMTVNIDAVDLDRCFVRVDSPTEVVLSTNIHGELNERHDLVNVKADIPEPFSFGKFLDPETFVIQAQSRFAPDEETDLQRLLDYVARIDVENGAAVSDDGISQSTEVRRRINGHLKQGEVAPQRLTLRPYRSFSEIDQPASQFVFRMTQKDSGIGCALFEADGGAWSHAARLAIKAHLSQALPGMAILA